MKRILKFFLLFGAALAGMLALSFFAPLPIPFLQDFSVMYFTDKCLLAGIPIYAYPAQLSFVRALTGPDFTFLPYPYPPWYALSTLGLGLLPIQVAARAWFLTNLALFGGSVWLLTPRFRPIPRILGFLAAVMFIPAFGLLVVGQYSAPVLLGAALFAWAAGRKSAFWLAAALLLLTFKPHIGGLLFLAGFIWLFFQKEPFARRALWFTLTAGLLLAMLGLLADPRWPLSYLESLGRYRDIPGVQTCGLCASLSVALIRVASGQSSTALAAWLSLVLALGLGILLFRSERARALLRQPAALMALFSVLTLLVDPYLLNYDYILLLVALFWLARREQRTWLVWLIYLVPWAALALGRDGNGVLSLAGIVTFILILRQPIDAPLREAYNHFHN